MNQNQALVIGVGADLLVTVADATAVAQSDRAVQALEWAGLIRPLAPDRLERYTRLAPEERDSVRRELAARRFSPPFSEQIIQDRGA